VEKNPSMKYFPDGWAILESLIIILKSPSIPLCLSLTGKRLPKGDDNGFSPLAKGS
jgi:hypothetical protein